MLPTSWQTGAGREAHSSRSSGPAAALHPPVCTLFQRAHACHSHEVPCQEGLALLLFPLSLSGSHGTAAGLFDEQALACSSCCWHQSLKSWLAPAVAVSSDRLSPMIQVFGGARHWAARSNGNMHPKSDTAASCRNQALLRGWTQALGDQHSLRR